MNIDIVNYIVSFLQSNGNSSKKIIFSFSIEKLYLNQEGILRISGSFTTVNKLKEQLLQG